MLLDISQASYNTIKLHFVHIKYFHNFKPSEQFAVQWKEVARGSCDPDGVFFLETDLKSNVIIVLKDKTYLYLLLCP